MLVFILLWLAADAVYVHIKRRHPDHWIIICGSIIYAIVAITIDADPILASIIGVVVILGLLFLNAMYKKPPH